jgi:hypothetical protein
MPLCLPFPTLISFFCHVIEIFKIIFPHFHQVFDFPMISFNKLIPIVKNRSDVSCQVNLFHFKSFLSRLISPWGEFPPFLCCFRNKVFTILILTYLIRIIFFISPLNFNPTNRSTHPKLTIVILNQIPNRS